MSKHEIVILPAPNCRRSRKVIQYLKEAGIAFKQVDLYSDEGQALQTQYDFRASPGIVVDGISINPFDIAIQPACRIDEEKAKALFGE
jgi:glutaredoxin